MSPLRRSYYARTRLNTLRRLGESRVLLAHVVRRRRKKFCPCPRNTEKFSRSRAARQFQRIGNIMKMSTADAFIPPTGIEVQVAFAIRSAVRCGCSPAQSDRSNTVSLHIARLKADVDISPMKTAIAPYR